MPFNTSIGGYPKGHTFGTVIGERHPTGREDILQYTRSAIIIPGPETREIESIAKKLNIFIVSGVIEKELVGGGTLWCSVIWVHPEQGLIGKRRKVTE